MLNVDGLWKVFGAGKPQTAIDMAKAGHSRAEIQAATAMTIGVRDVSFDVAKGETSVMCADARWAWCSSISVFSLIAG